MPRRSRNSGDGGQRELAADVSARSSGRVVERVGKAAGPGPERGSRSNDCLSSSRVFLTTAPGVSPVRLAGLGNQLTERECEILATLAKLRLACTRQIEALHFTDASPLANARHARRVLVKLADLGLVSRLERRVGGVRAGSAGYVWSLGVAGQALVTRRGPAGGSKLQSPWTPGRAFLAHRLSISGLYVELVQAGRAGELELLRFEAEPTAWRSFTGAHGAPVRLKPDAYVQVGLGEYLDSYFVEVDLATESPGVIARKAVVYRSYWQTGREQATHDGVFPLIAFLVPTPARARVVTQVLHQQPVDTSGLFRVGLLTDAVAILTAEGGQ